MPVRLEKTPAISATAGAALAADKTRILSAAVLLEAGYAVKTNAANKRGMGNGQSRFFTRQILMTYLVHHSPCFHPGQGSMWWVWSRPFLAYVASRLAFFEVSHARRLD